MQIYFLHISYQHIYEDAFILNYHHHNHYSQCFIVSHIVLLTSKYYSIIPWSFDELLAAKMAGGVRLSSSFLCIFQCLSDIRSGQSRSV